LETKKIKKILVEEILFREDLYPRLEKIPKLFKSMQRILKRSHPLKLISTMKSYTDGVDGRLIRKPRHRKSMLLSQKPKAILNCLSWPLNEIQNMDCSFHGTIKRNVARKIYHVTPENEREAKKKYLAKILSVSERTVRE
jgi:hypothetical protein